MNSKIIHIVATDKNGVIGKNNDIPWHSKEDFKHFKETTRLSVLIMGRKTYESIGRPLPYRVNIIVSRTLKSDIDKGIIVVDSIENALKKAKEYNNDKIFIIGGESIYSGTEKYVDEAIITRFPFAVEGGDTHYNDSFLGDFKLIANDIRDEFCIEYYRRK